MSSRCESVCSGRAGSGLRPPPQRALEWQFLPLGSACRLGRSVPTPRGSLAGLLWFQTRRIRIRSFCGLGGGGFLIRTRLRSLDAAACVGQVSRPRANGSGAETEPAPRTDTRFHWSWRKRSDKTSWPSTNVGFLKTTLRHPRTHSRYQNELVQRVHRIQGRRDAGASEALERANALRTISALAG